MNRRSFLAALSLTAPSAVAGCLAPGRTEDAHPTNTTPEPLEAEISVLQSGVTTRNGSFSVVEYGGTLTVVHQATGEVVVERTFQSELSMGTPDEDGVQTGFGSGGGFYHPTVTPNDTYVVTVTVENASERYEWTPRGPYGLSVRTTPDRVTFEEGRKTFRPIPTPTPTPSD
ncbi:hypothetical protein [Halomarina oriensis]|uniref:Uncharacterized protein n=1 Tax=Halomarina oriensis TaxID=671145 RepID=A0A6B0GU72_9EURY|nr:hypothetical protein [Halomarina oriensis]MWG35685.1 hypothetical protein [Halomarina oriensis]